MPSDNLEAQGNRSHCPNCGSSGLGGQGEFTREQSAMAEDGRMVKYVSRWYQMHCSDCGQVFAVQESVGEVYPGDDPIHAE